MGLSYARKKELAVLALPETSKVTEMAKIYMATVLTFAPSTPANSSAACSPGQLWADATYVYVCTATNTIKRAALSSF